MKTTIGIFLAILLSTGIAFGQSPSARAQLRADPAIQALGLSNEQLDEVLKRLADFYEIHDAKEREITARNRADKILSEDPALRTRLMNERAPERAAEEAALNQ